jgi:hypothetical protein
MLWLRLWHAVQDIYKLPRLGGCTVSVCLVLRSRNFPRNVWPQWSDCWPLNSLVILWIHVFTLTGLHYFLDSKWISCVHFKVLVTILECLACGHGFLHFLKISARRIYITPLYCIIILAFSFGRAKIVQVGGVCHGVDSLQCPQLTITKSVMKFLSTDISLTRTA